MVWVGLFLFFVFFPPLLAYQHGRPWTLAIPALLVFVSVQWAIADDSAWDNHGLTRIALVLAIAGFFLTAGALALARQREGHRR